MQLIRGVHNLTAEHRGCVATIGNFDGVHLGHRAVFEALLARGRAMGLPAVVITFEPQPLEYFRPEQAPARLTRLREKLQALHESGIDRVLLLEFHHGLAEMGASEFIERVLVRGLGVRHLYVGDDFRFGK
ncbi:MAG: bifunctional riboflavin kinase/FAD synthetase, partial [Pseudomonadota bacterium]